MKLHYIVLLVFAISYNNFSQQLSPDGLKWIGLIIMDVINDQLLVMKTMESQYPGYYEQVSKVFKKINQGKTIRTIKIFYTKLVLLFMLFINHLKKTFGWYLFILK